MKGEHPGLAEEQGSRQAGGVKRGTNTLTCVFGSRNWWVPLLRLRRLREKRFSLEEWNKSRPADDICDVY